MFCWLFIPVSFIHSLVLSLTGRVGRNQSPVMWPVWLLAHCILGKFMEVVCHCFPPTLDVPTFAARCLYVRNDARDPSSGMWNCGREICPVILPKFRLPLKFRDLLHAANLRHGTASAGFEPANLDTKGQHATLRPPTPMHPCVICFKWSQLGAHYFLVYLFQLLYMFRATMGPSPAELTVSMRRW